ncbi:MAG: hypothetical protein AAFO93_10355 [Pseudomonadota bacterium]
MRSISLALFAVVTVAACAKQPDQIAAVPVAGDPYSRLGCKALASEHLKISQELEAASAAQKAAANGDAWGVVLLGLPLSSMTGGDKETLIAIAKGRLNEIRRVQVEKGCVVVQPTAG